MDGWDKLIEAATQTTQVTMERARRLEEHRRQHRERDTDMTIEELYDEIERFDHAAELAEEIDLGSEPEASAMTTCGPVYTGKLRRKRSGMPKGFKFPFVICEGCGKPGARNWIVRHLVKSVGAIAGARSGRRSKFSGTPFRGTISQSNSIQRRGTMKRAVVLIVVAVFLLSIAGVAGATDTPRPPVQVSTVSVIPANAMTILYEDFEGPIDDRWTFTDQYSGIAPGGYDSEHALGQGFSPDTLTYAIHNLEGIDFSNYAEPIWLQICYQVFSEEWNVDPTVNDVGEGSFYTNEGMSVAWLWQLTNLDHSGGWYEENCPVYRVEGLTTWADGLDFVFGASNSAERPTTFFYDRWRILGVPRYKTFIPLLTR